MIKFLDLKTTDPVSKKALHIFQGFTAFNGLFIPLFTFLSKDYLYVIEHLSFLHLFPLAASLFAVHLHNFSPPFDLGRLFLLDLLLDGWSFDILGLFLFLFGLAGFLRGFTLSKDHSAAGFSVEVQFQIA